MRSVRHVIYLHGFASSPASSKAQRFAAELAARGIACVCPDFNDPDFETLTVTRMLDQTAAAIAAAPDGPLALVGSSLGAFVAVHAAIRDARGAQPRVDRLVLLAPALDFGGNRLRQLGEHGIDEWRTAGKLRVFHHAYQTERDVGFALYEDAARYDAFGVDLDLPALVFQGTRDASVDPSMVERWARARANVNLTMLDDEHQLTTSIDRIWRESAVFFGLSA
jgi:hypothetical protein